MRFHTLYMLTRDLSMSNFILIDNSPPITYIALLGKHKRKFWEYTVTGWAMSLKRALVFQQKGCEHWV
jgi:hypothetical protein